MKILLIVTMSLFSAFAFSGECKNVEVPDSIQNKVKSLYPEAQKIHWEKEGKNIEATIKIEISLTIDAEGNIIEKEIPLCPTKLPQSISKSIAEKYPGFKVEKAEKVEVNMEVSYEVEIEKSFLFWEKEIELICTEEGEINEFKEDDEK
jgi:hypothetical protein